MEQKSFLKRTAIPVLLAILLVTSVQLIPQRLPEAILPASAEGVRCQAALVEQGAVIRTATLTAEEVTSLLTGLQAARAQNRGQAGDLADRPLLCRLTFTPPGEGGTYELSLDPEGRLFAGGKLYKLQGANPRALFETVQGRLAAGEAAPIGEAAP